MANATIANTMHPLAVSADGTEIYVNLIQSPAAMRIGHQPHILTLATRLLKNARLKGANVALEHDFGRPIGNTDVVETTPTDVVFYAKPIKQDIYTRFVKRRNLATSSVLSLSLVQDADGNYELHDVHVGQYCPPLPGSHNETTASKPYWQTHAIVLEKQAIQHQTITKDMPY